MIEKRRFGKTGIQMPVLTCGGMRYHHHWKDDEAARKSIPEENQKNLEATVRYALDLGINHIETARSYGTSEYQLGKIFPTLPRDKIIVQTKIIPKDTLAEFLEDFELSMAALQLDHIDLLTIHGINSEEVLQQTLKYMPEIERLKKEGRCRHIGFSTHGTPALSIKAIETGLFDYVNLHWYFVYHPVNWPSVEAAAKHDMGVFIISPVDKGGRLYEPPPKLIDLCQPLTPISFNDLFCLRRPEIHTLAIGAARPSDLVEHVSAATNMEEKFPMVGKIEARILHCLEKEFGTDWVQHWHEGLPRWQDTPGEINIPEILRLWTYAKGLDMVEFGKMRYNLMGHAGHWFGGLPAAEFKDEDLKPLLEKSRFADRIPEILREAHALLHDKPKKRLSES